MELKAVRAFPDKPVSHTNQDFSSYPERSSNMQGIPI